MLPFSAGACVGGLIACGAPAFAQDCGWHQIEAPGPSARHSPAMAYDSAREVMVLFGGLDGDERDATLFGDTWEWDRTQWTKVADTGPSPRMGHGMVYDSARGVTVLFGGSSASGFQNDTWEWDGATWTKAAGTGPEARNRHGMAYDSVRGVTVLFGGIPRDFGETWEWDGTDWTEVAGTGPSGRSRVPLAYDPGREVTVLFGGRLASGHPDGETWEWDGMQWRQVADDPALRRSRHAMVHDSARGVLLVFGGNAGPNLKDTLEWDGASWRQAATAGPSGRVYYGMAYDRGRGTVLLFGGWGGGGVMGDTWEYRCPDLFPAATLQSPLQGSPGFEFFVQGAVNLDHVVEASFDLSQWIPLRTNRGPFTFVDAAATNVSRRFYRVISRP